MFNAPGARTEFRFVGASRARPRHREALLDSGRQRCIARSIAAAMVLAAFGSVTPLRAEPPLQDLTPQHEMLFNDLESIRAVFTGADGVSLAVGAFAAPADGNGGVLLELDAQLREVKRKPIAKPKPAGASDTVRRNVVEGATVLAGGDLLVYGNVEIGAGGATARREGWAARIGSDGSERWSRMWPGPSAAREEYLYFARPMPSGAILLGGKRQASSNCNDGSSGVAFEIDPASGDMRGERRLYSGGVTRQGFRDAAVQPDGSITFAGWIGGDTATDRCRDDGWILSVAADKTAGLGQRIRGLEGDALFAHVGDIGGASVFSGFVSGSRVGSTDGLIATVPHIGQAMQRRSVAPVAGGRARLEASARLGSGRLHASLGHIATSTSTAANAGEGGWLRLHAAEPLCGHDLRIAAKVDTRLLAADMATSSGVRRVVVAGQARKAGARTSVGWIGAADIAAVAGDLGTLAANAERTLLAATAAGAGTGAGSARATVKFSLATAAPVRIVADPLTRADIMLALRPDNGKSLWLADLPWSGAEAIERQLPAGAYTLEIVSPQPAAIVSVTAAIRSASAAPPAFEIEALRPLIGDALGAIGIDSDGSDGHEFGQIVAALEARQCHDGRRVEGLRALFVTAAQRAAAHGKDAALAWRSASRSPAIVTRKLVAASADDAETSGDAADDAPGLGSVRFLEVPGHDRILGELKISGYLTYEGELSIALADRHNQRIAFSPRLINGHGVQHDIAGTQTAGRFADSHAAGAVEIRFKAGDIFLGLVAHTTNVDGTKNLRPIYGAVLDADGKLDLIGSTAQALAPCPAGTTRSSSRTELMCVPMQMSAFPGAMRGGATGGAAREADDGGSSAEAEVDGPSEGEPVGDGPQQ